MRRPIERRTGDYRVAVYINGETDTRMQSITGGSVEGYAIFQGPFVSFPHIDPHATGGTWP